MGDRRNRYMDILFKDNRRTDTVISCEKCGSKEVNVKEHATRSADEGVTLFITCKLCNHVYVDQGQ
jgi:DNA-directed RNA polymerase subunit M/transcription elongation factor TFIIS